MKSKLVATAFSILIITLFSVYVYVFSEWLFFTTKPSFLSSLTAIDAFKTFLLTAFSIFLPGLLFITLLLGILLLISNITKSKKLIVILFRCSLLVIPTLVFSTTILLLVDNFTYTVFDFGIIHTNNHSRWFYTGGYFVVAIFIYLWLMNLESRLRCSSKLLRKYIIFVCLGLLIFSGGSLAFVNQEGIVWANYLREAGINPRLINRPNIIFYSSDGLNANSLSAYGYERETTPNIDRFIKTHNVLFFENAFVNSAHTSSSLISILNSKYPFTTRVIEPPEILRGKDSLEHLPAILKGLGYRSIFYGTRHYADPYDANMIGAFDIANDRKGPSSVVYDKLSSIVGQMTTYFVRQIYERVSERLLHIFGVCQMEDFYTAITKGELFTSFHKNKNQKLFAFMDESDTPVFAHIHFLETHGPKYRFPNEDAYFSKGRKQDKKYDIDFYDDSIRGFDAKFGSLINYLEEAGKSQNTIIIITSDHGFKWTELERVPLLMYFPKGHYNARIKKNVQTLDITPTILDYLGLTIPEWMEGQSLLRPSKINEIPILAVNRWERRKFKEDEEIPRESIMGKLPPHYLFGRLTGIFCDTALTYRLSAGRIVRKKVAGHTGDCSESLVPNNEEFKQMIIDHLRKRRYDVTFLIDSK